jgi:hypothetical protein
LAITGREGKTMVVFQAIGAAASFVDEAEAKAEIRKIEVANQAIRDALIAKVGANATEEQREEALQELQNENPLFHEAVRAKLFELVLSFA